MIESLALLYEAAEPIAQKKRGRKLEGKDPYEARLRKPPTARSNRKKIIDDQLATSDDNHTGFILVSNPQTGTVLEEELSFKSKAGEPKLESLKSAMRLRFKVSVDTVHNLRTKEEDDEDAQRDFIWADAELSEQTGRDQAIPPDFFRQSAFMKGGFVRLQVRLDKQSYKNPIDYDTIIPQDGQQINFVLAE